MGAYTTDIWQQMNLKKTLAGEDPEWRQKMISGYTDCYQVASNWPQQSLDRNPITKVFGRSEAFPGSFCNVVCSRGRNNVPLCQEDGTWTDIPRCIEHDPGVEEQVPGLCPGIPGYCAVGFINTQCKFDCYTGPDIDSICSADGTWAPYPTCEGDLRETQDGCDGCPGPLGEIRNRTAESIIASNPVSDRRVPKIVGDSEGRKNVPSFAGNINIGPVETKPVERERLTPTPKTTTRDPP